MNGDVHPDGSGTVLGLPTQVTSKSYDEVYGPGFYWAAGLGYRVGELAELRIRGSYTSNPAERLQVGTVAGLPLFGLFDDCEAFGMDFGYRQYFGRGWIQPFAGADVGFVRLQTVTSEFSVPAAGVVLSDVGFLDSSVQRNSSDPSVRCSVVFCGTSRGANAAITEWFTPCVARV